MEWDYAKPWYHGSPERLTYTRQGSTITQDRDLARVFSHKPTFVSCYTDSDGRYRLRHSGTRPGYLYRIAESVSAEDVYPQPRTTMRSGAEWITMRDLRVELVSTTIVVPEEMLAQDELDELQRRFALQRAP